jgi:hypothetical protein
MPTRRSMLKWIPAACFAGWCGLRPASAAMPASASLGLRYAIEHNRVER